MMRGSREPTLDPMRRFRVLLLALTGLLGVLAAGCGESATTGSAPAPLQSLTGVATASRDAASGRFELTLTQSFAGQELTLGAEGAFDTATNRSEVTFDMSALAKLLGGLGQAFGGDSADLEGFDDPDNWRLDAIQDGTVVYLRFPLLSAKLPDGKEWIRADAAALAKQRGVDLDQLGSFASVDPRDALGALEAVTGGLVVVGREQVRGVETTHYTAAIDPAKLAGQLGGASGDVLSSFRQALAQLGVTAVPIEVWVDDDGLLRRFSIDVAMTPQGSAGEARMQMALEVFDYGAPVEVDLPDGGDVAELTELTGP